MKLGSVHFETLQNGNPTLTGENNDAAVNNTVAARTSLPVFPVEVTLEQLVVVPKAQIGLPGVSLKSLKAIYS